MTQFEPPQPTEPGTVRLGGGRSARVAAVLVAAALIGVAWIGFSGRPTPQPVQSSRPVAVTSPTEPASPLAASTPAPTPPLVAGPAPGPVAYEPDDVFGAYVELGDSQFITILSEPERGHLVGSLKLPIPPPATRGFFVFQQFSSPSLPGRPVHIERWPLGVEALVAASGREHVVVVDTVSAQPWLAFAPRPVLRGFQITVRAQSGLESGEIRIDIQIGPGRQIRGDDGIFGWPVVALIPPEPEVVLVDLDGRRSRYNYCRLDITHLSAPPVPGIDKENC